MAVFELCSKRKKRLNASQVEIFTYDEIPQDLRVQIVHIWRDSFGDSVHLGESSVVAEVHAALSREFGVFRLGREHDDAFSATANYFLQSTDNDRVLDMIEFTFGIVDGLRNDWNFQTYSRPKVSADRAIDELNQRFLEHGIGYEYMGGTLIRKDREFIHQEIVLPALIVLSDKKFAGANQEYLSAHDHYRHGKHKEALNDCLKSFESTMKTICLLKGWAVDPNATAKQLIDACFKNELVPSFLQAEIGSLRAALESGIPTVRNKLSGHGQGAVPLQVPSYFVSYLLNTTAATIAFLVDAANL